MLKSLQIKNFVLIDSLDVEFPEGLVIITGQTGAGKSILLAALSLLLGGKADPAQIGSGGDNCVVEGVFSVPETDSLLSGILSGNEVDCEDGELVIRRVVSRTGRSRSFIGDAPVSLALLQSISSRLVDIHSQHGATLLQDHAYQLSMLDHYAGNGELLAACRKTFTDLKSSTKELDSLRQKLSGARNERDYITARWQRLESAALKEGEMEILEEEHRRLANANEIRENLCGVEEIFNPSGPEAGLAPLTSLLKDARKLLEKTGRFLPEAASLADRIESSRAELEDILEEVESLESRMDSPEGDLGSVEERMALLHDLMNAYSVNSVEELIAERDALSGQVFDSSALEEKVSILQKRVASLQDEYSGICARLHKAREAAAPSFSSAVTGSVRSLELDRAVFEADISESGPSASGTDAVAFLFSASGSDPVDVGRYASGGEMSRLMLCLKAMMARFVNMPTLIFDEIDSGVSGSVADKMGQMICSMGSDMQVFAITHLPQVAAKGNAHYLVEKETDVLGTRDTTSIRQVEGEERVMEVARMLSGSRITAAAVENARTLLSEGPISQS